MVTKYSSDIRPSLVSWNQGVDCSSYVSHGSLSERPESPTLPIDESYDDDQQYRYALPTPTTDRSTLISSRRPSESCNTQISTTSIDYSSTRSSPVRFLSSPIETAQRRHVKHQPSSKSSTVPYQIQLPTSADNPSPPIAPSSPGISAVTTSRQKTNGNTSSLSVSRHHTNSHHKMNSSVSNLSSTKRSRPPLTDYAAAAIELTSSSGAQNPPAPAAGMYWSRVITYGKAPTRPLRAHSANMVGEMMYVFGGCNQKTCFNHLYILDMDTLSWTKPHTFGQVPPPLRAHSCNVIEYMVGKRKSYFLYVFGGGDGPNYFNDIYVLNVDTLTWTKPSVHGKPISPRRAHATCVWQDKIVIVGGGNGTQALSDVYVLDVSDPNRLCWSEIKPSGPAPMARGYHTGNLIKDKLVIYGGSDGHDCFRDIHILNLTTNHWSQIELDRAIPRLSHSSTQVGSYLFIIGGHDGFKYSNDVILLNLVTMTCETKKIYGSPPGPRGYHTAVLHDCRLYILGGYDGTHVFDDLYTLELSSCAYLPQITNFDIDV
ncbi:uncharacterized protein BX664DRAFT_333243 [Halteromyces radiatus]|uniref:uncharacterized protein n=1 Tax=Halteromyces radiatus TaxID=101107 RepID=UPI00221E9F6F|nr:uncharacterized protein BX664DRAFT_333243 [Halteromyces radiatus]KAI8089529.1 hypothetical protein BX664DRAFT_333243 [Halteromyces radiatus]